MSGTENGEQINIVPPPRTRRAVHASEHSVSFFDESVNESFGYNQSMNGTKDSLSVRAKRFIKGVRGRMQ